MSRWWWQKSYQASYQDYRVPSIPISWQLLEIEQCNVFSTDSSIVTVVEMLCVMWYTNKKSNCKCNKIILIEKVPRWNFFLESPEQKVQGQSSKAL